MVHVVSLEQVCTVVQLPANRNEASELQTEALWPVHPG